METIVLNKHELTLDRLKLREWLALEDIKTKFIEAVDTQDLDGITKYVLSYVSTATFIEGLEDVEWLEIVTAFLKIGHVNLPKLDYPILKSKISNEVQSWDYEGRTWYIWSHLLLSNFSWDLEYVAKLDIDDAIALAQEILVGEQLEREWQWSLSQVAYSYDSGTKQTKFNQLPRPSWMAVQHAQVGKASVIKKVRIKQSMMPVGLVLRADKDEETELQ